MFAIRLRVRPWSARCSPRSVGRDTRIWPSSCFTSISRLLRSDSSPFGPLTLTSSGSMAISTPSGTETGCFPMRLTSPHLCDELAAHAGALCVVAGHDALRGRHDRRAHAALHLRHRAGRHVLATARLRDALDALDDRLAVLRVLEPHAQHAPDPGGLNFVAVDVALLLQDARDLRLQVRGGHLHVVAVGVQAVADAGEEVGYRIGHRHGSTSSTSSGRGSCPRARSRARRFGTGRTSAGTRAGGRSACSGCSCVSGTWTRAAGGPSVTSLPSTPVSPWRARPLRRPRPPRPLPGESAFRTPPGSLPSTARKRRPRPQPWHEPPPGGPPHPGPPRARRSPARPRARTASPTLAEGRMPPRRSWRSS